jgi:hypothetical protein
VRWVESHASLFVAPSSSVPGSSRCENEREERLRATTTSSANALVFALPQIYITKSQQRVQVGDKKGCAYPRCWLHENDDTPSRSVSAVHAAKTAPCELVRRPAVEQRAGGE